MNKIREILTPLLIDLATTDCIDCRYLKVRCNEGDDCILLENVWHEISQLSALIPTVAPQEALCPECGSYMDWVDCYNCEDGYSYHDCGEDCCCCADPELNVVCGICGGKTGWWICQNLENHIVTEEPQEGLLTDASFESYEVTLRDQYNSYLALNDWTPFEGWLIREIMRLEKILAQHEKSRGKPLPSAPEGEG